MPGFDAVSAFYPMMRISDYIYTHLMCIYIYIYINSIHIYIYICMYVYPWSLFNVYIYTVHMSVYHFCFSPSWESPPLFAFFRNGCKKTAEEIAELPSEVVSKSKQNADAAVEAALKDAKESKERGLQINLLSTCV